METAVISEASGISDDPLASRLVRSPMELKVLGAESRSETMGLWRQFEHHIGSRRLACSSIWTSTWLDHFGDYIPHRFAIAYRNGEPCGFALLTNGVGQFDGPFPLNTWHIGTAGEPDQDSVCIEYNTVLCRPNDHLDFLEQLINWTLSQSDTDATLLDGFGSNDIESILLHRPGAVVTRKNASVYDLQKARDAGVEPIELLGRRTRASIRRSMRQIGMPTGEWADSVDRAVDIFNEMVVLHQTRWNAIGKPGVYASKRFTDFHRALIEQLVPKQQMVLYRVASPTGVVGISHAYVDDDRVAGYQLGWTQQAGDSSPGLVIDYLLISECMRRGYRYFDFLAGESDYKRRLSTNTVKLVWATWRKPRLKFAIIENLRRIRNAIRAVQKSLQGASLSSLELPPSSQPSSEKEET